MGGGYVFRMKGEQSLIKNQLNLLQEYNWIDKQTSALFIEFTIYNSNINMFQWCVLLFEVLPSGSFVNSFTLTPIDLYEMDSRAFFSFKIINYFLFLLFIISFILTEMIQVVQKKRKYFLEFYNYIDLVIIVSSWTAFAMYLNRLYASYGIFEQLRDSSISFNDKFINLQFITSYDRLLNIFLGLSVTFTIFRFIKLLRFSKRIIVFMEAFKRSLKEICALMIIFLIVYFSFTQVFYLLLITETKQFSSFVESLLTCFQILLGKFNSNTFASSNTLLAQLLFVAYNVIVLFVLVNLMVSILTQYFDLVQKDRNLEKNDPQLFQFLKRKLKEMFSFWLRKNNEQRQVKHSCLNYWEYNTKKVDDFIEKFRKVVFILCLNLESFNN